MNILQRTVQVVAGLFRPASHTPTLSPRAEALLAKISVMVGEEARKSEEFGLSILPEHLEKEAHVVLLAVAELGNMNIPDNYGGPDFLYRLLYESASRLMEEEARFYFERLKGQGLVANMYQAHLATLCSRIACMIRNNELE